MDYCQGHGEIGDPVGFATLRRHDEDDHSECVGECADSWLEEAYEDRWSDVEADADTLASAGWGTDEDYGLIGGDSDLLGEW